MSDLEDTSDSAAPVRTSARLNKGKLPVHLNPYQVSDFNLNIDHERSGNDDSQGESPCEPLDETVMQCTAADYERNELRATVKLLSEQLQQMKSNFELSQSQYKLENDRLKELLSRQSTPQIEPSCSNTTALPNLTYLLPNPSSALAINANYSQTVPSFTFPNTMPNNNNFNSSTASTLPPSTSTHRCSSTTTKPSYISTSSQQANMQTQCTNVVCSQHAFNNEAAARNMHLPFSNDNNYPLASTQCQHNGLPSTNAYYFPNCIPSASMPTDDRRQPNIINSNTMFDTRRKLHELPIFSGQPEEWPMFANTYRQSTAAYGYSNLENAFRLQRCLKGDARESVECLLIHADNVEIAMSQLKLRFGQPDQLIRSQIRKVRELPSVSERNLELLIPMATKVRNLTAFLQSTNSHQHLGNPTLIEELVGKLPVNKRLEWAQYSIGIKPYVTICNVSDWLDNQARLISLVDLNPSNYQRKLTDDKRKRSMNTVLHSHPVAPVKVEPKCSMCQSTHFISDCGAFKRLSIADRWALIKRKSLCFSCLKYGHSTRTCKSRKECGMDGCEKFHHSALHERARRNAESTTNAAVQTVSTFSGFSSELSGEKVELLFRILPVKVFGPNIELETFALLDEGSSVSLIDEQFARELGLTGKPEPLHLQWFGNKQSTELSSSLKLEISSVKPGAKRFSMSDVKTVRNISLPSQTLNMSKLHSKYKHIRDLPIKGYSNALPLILIGIDNCHLGLPKQSVTCSVTGPVVARTKLGWVVYGPSDVSHFVGYSRTANIPTQESPSRDDFLHQQIAEYLASENFAVKKVQPIESDDDMRARRLLDATTVRIQDRYQTGLLWKRDDVQLPPSYEMALKRLISIERKMSRDHLYAASYREIIYDYLSKGYARQLTEQEVNDTNAKIWYLPHFSVQNPNKPGKIRLVFDAAAAVNSTSLNSELLKGPDLNQPLLNVLFNFRMRKVPVSADIKEMFHQVQMKPTDRHSQRFLWRDGKSSKQVGIYAMDVMTFGATCSPYSAQFVKNKNACAYEQTHPRAVKAIVRHHYVDDYVDSFDSVKEAIEVSRNVRQIHKGGGFELRKFVSNMREVSDDLNGCERGVQNVNMYIENSTPTEKILGLYWDTEDDMFKFSLNFSRVSGDLISGERRPTKRELLSLIMSVYDPFGMLSNIMIDAKILLQIVWRSGIGWDETLPGEINAKWLIWLGKLDLVNRFRIPRCYSTGLSTAVDVQLHTFVDASESAFAAVCFLRVETSDRIEVAFVSGKSICAPLKLLSIPRLELQSAVLGTRLSRCVMENHELSINRRVYWSDSKTVVGWIGSDHRRYKPYVAHRIAEILEETIVSEWRWIASRMNPADEATRVKSKTQSAAQGRWTLGPDFLLVSEEQWPVVASIISKLCEEEIRPKYLQVLLAGKVATTNSCLGISIHRPMLNVKELDRAESELCRQAQRDVFADEVAALANGEAVRTTSCLYQLTPCLDENGLLRLSGRIDAASSISVAVRRPVILPPRHPLTNLIVAHYHKRLRHQNHDTIVNEIRQRFWITHLRAAVKRVASSCPFCKVRRARPQVPMMGQLPEDRLKPFVRPFSYTGVDYFGAIFVSIGRRREKRWVAIFTCLTVRAIHLELAGDLSTDSCLLCIRNFVNRRGTPIRIRSDNGTNFVGASRELAAAVATFDNDRIQSELSGRRIEWVFNCPGNPSAGGCWERIVRSVKRVLAITLNEYAPRVETLRSLLIEAECIVNSRPLTHLPLTADADDPLTPNHFLLGTSNSTQTPAPADQKLGCMRKQWRIAQQLQTVFWKRWIIEYLPTLTRRTKWFAKVDPLKEGDLVMICDPDISTRQWSRGRVVRVFPGTDGQVRSADVKTSTGVLKKPASKLAKLDVIEGESSGSAQ